MTVLAFCPCLVGLNFVCGGGSWFFWVVVLWFLGTLATRLSPKARRGEGKPLTSNCKPSSYQTSSAGIGSPNMLI